MYYLLLTKTLLLATLIVVVVVVVVVVWKTMQLQMKPFPLNAGVDPGKKLDRFTRV